MTKHITFLFFTSFFFITGCKKDESKLSAKFFTAVIHGYQMRDENANIIGNAGTPDIYLGNSNDFSVLGDYHIETFPNPQYAGGRMSLDVYVKKPYAKVHMWVEHAVLNQSPDMSVQYFSSLECTGNIIEYDATIGMNAGYNNFLLDFSKAPAGAYRLYVQLDDILLWDNLVLSKLY